MNLLQRSVFADHDVFRHLRSLGVGRLDVEKLFDSFSGSPPSCLRIDAKLSGLRDRGFADPVKMIVSSPAILGLAFENIDAKLRYGSRLKIDAVLLIERWPQLLGYSLKRIHFCARVVSYVSAADDYNLFRLLTTKEPSAVAAAALAPSIASGASFPRCVTARAGRTAENAALIRAYAHTRIATSYRRYVGISPAPAAVRKAA